MSAGVPVHGALDDDPGRGCAEALDEGAEAPVEVRFDPARQFLVELVGFWTPEYLHRKLAHLREARLDNLILCVDEDQACADDLIPEGSRLVRFHRRIDPLAVLRAAGYMR